jgi:hypothetical protein
VRSLLGRHRQRHGCLPSVLGDKEFDMSADNTMVIQYRNGKWHVWMALGDPEDGGWEPRGSYYRIFDDEIDAHHYAHSVCEEEIVEYGVVCLQGEDAA